jgi:coenzyme F420-reducing hydrogenase alpha subunit
MLAACTLRRLLHCGEWIGSHALHISMLHAPDFLGYPGVVEMASDHREIVERGLSLGDAVGLARALAAAVLADVTAGASAGH